MLRSSMARRSLLLSLLALGACGQVPRPFRPREKKPLPLRVGPRAALAVDLSAIPAPWRKPMLAALRQREIAAFESSAQPPNRYYAVAGVKGSALRWQVYDPAGREIGSKEITAAAAENKPLPPVIARRAAVALDNVLPGIQRAATALYIPPVDGAPGDGRISLTDALRERLRRSGYRIARDVGTADYILLGAVRLDPPADGRQHITLTWALIAPDGREMGRVEQQNSIPAGQLDGPWGAIAAAAAEGAAAGMNDLLRRLRPEREAR